MDQRYKERDSNKEEGQKERKKGTKEKGRDRG